MNIFAYNERKASHDRSYPVAQPDMIDIPDVLVSEVEATPDTMRSYVEAEQRKAVTLVEEADAVWRYAAWKERR